MRSFLADKLNCDPMRITKKFAGASCLGRRVFHLRNRPQPSYEEIQQAKAELDHLEQRFRLRVEHGYGGMPLSNPPGMMLKFVTPAEPAPAPSNNFMAHPTPAPQAPPPQAVNNDAGSNAAAQTFLQNLAAAAAAAANGQQTNGTPTPPTFPFPMPSMAPSLAPAPGPAPPSQVPSQVPSLNGFPPAAAQWLFNTSQANIGIPSAPPVAPPPPT